MAESDGQRTRSRVALLLGVALAGGAGWIVDVTTLWVLAVHLRVPTPVAAGIAYLTSAVVNFLLNRRVFQAQGGRTARQTKRYVLLVGLNVLIVAALVPLFAHLLRPALAGANLRLLAAKIVTTAILLPFNAVVYHRWVFAGTPAESRPDVADRAA